MLSGAPARIAYTALWCAALPFLPVRLWWRGRREPTYRSHIGERFGRPLLAVRSPHRVELLRALRALPDAHSVFPFGDAVHYSDARADRSGPAVAAELQRELAQQGIADAEIAPVEPGIEDVFMELMLRAPAEAA